MCIDYESLRDYQSNTFKWKDYTRYHSKCRISGGIKMTLGNTNNLSNSLYALII